VGYRIVLTADSTLMSSYNGSMFIGFAACFPRVLPKQLYSRLFCPSERHRNGQVTAVPAGLRRVEAALVAAGVPHSDIAMGHPDSLSKVVDEDTKVVGITTSDPLGHGPASSTFSSLIGKEPYTAFYFRNLVTDPAIRSSGARVIVGGPGTWQLADDSVMSQLGIDCVVEGEGELVAQELFQDALRGRPLPRHVSGVAVSLGQVPSMMGPTINGTVEVSRGCGRGCEFCNPTMRLVRHFPLETILREVRTNLTHGPKITLHAEDVLRYRAKGMTPERQEVVRLYEEVLKLTPRVGMSHFALSSALAEPGLVEDISDLTGASEGKCHVYGQTGIETGSPDLVSRHMKGKAKPFKPEEWPGVVRESFKLLSDNNWVPCGTLVMGMPGETPEDVSMTLELVRDLREYSSLIVPLFFVPLGELRSGSSFRPDAMLPEHWMLFAECIEHDFRWIDLLMDQLFAQNRLSGTKARLFKLTAWYMQRRLRPYLELMNEGKNPLKNGRSQEDLESEAGEEDIGERGPEGAEA
jgi:radical SAM superfamily enzyme YgiQ (UPF0313 family)